MKRLWNWLRRKIGLVIVERIETKVVERVAVFNDAYRFHVIYRTDRGAEARDIYAVLVPRTGVVELFDGAACRGRKVSADGE